jgi:hypothetical protein
VKQPNPATTNKFTLNGRDVRGITAELRSPEHSTGDVASLDANRGKCYQGPIPAGNGFIIESDEAKRLLDLSDASYSTVVRPYLGSADVARNVHQAASRWAIDFGLMSLEEAMKYSAALDIVRERVKPVRARNNREVYRRKWWQFAEPRRGLRQAVMDLDRYIVLGRLGKRLLFVWADAWIIAGDATNVFAFDDDYAMGILSSSTHDAWAKARSSTLEDRLRYTPSSVFETFPWPFPVTDTQRERVAEASRRVIAHRQDICSANNFGLTALYNAIDEGAYTDLKSMHRELDEAVAAAYGWPKAVARDGDEIVQRLLILNGEIAAGTREYDPFDEELIFIPPPRAEVTRGTPENQPHHSKPPPV